MTEQWAVCFVPITWGEVIGKPHLENIWIRVGGKVTKFGTSAVLLFSDKNKAQECYQESLIVAERLKTGI
jgi:hypothetical protein